MQNHDSEIDFNDLPSLQTEKRDDARPSSSKTAKAAKTKEISSQSASALNKLFVILLLIIVVLFYLCFQLYSEANKLNARVMDLEKRLSTTDQSLNQSGVQLQISIKELQDKESKLEEEMDKFWSSTWKQSQTDMQSHGKNITALIAAKNASTEKITLLEASVTGYRAELDVLNAKAETLSSVDAAVKQQTKALADSKTELKGQITQLQSANSALQKKVDANNGWIESNNAFRQQTNSSLSRLEQQVKSLQTPAAK